MTDFFKGLGDVKRGFIYLKDNPGLLRVLIIPFLINIGLLVGLFYLIFHYYTLLFDTIAAFLGGLTIIESSWWAKVIAFFLWFVRGLLHTLLGFILIASLFIAMLFLSQIINSPFYDFLSEAVEAKVTGQKNAQPFAIGRLLRDAIKTMVIELKKLFFFLFASMLLLLLHLVPIVGSLLYTVAVYLFMAWDFGYNYLAYAMGRKLIPFSTQIGLARHHKARLVGFGAFLLIPLFNVLLAPLFVIGGTLLYLDIRESPLQATQ